MQRKIARRTSLAILAIYLDTIWVGQFLLGFLGINVASLQTAGGLLIILTGIGMVQAKRRDLSKEETKEASEDDDWKSMAVVPLAIPLSVSGGTIALIVATAGQFQNFLSLTIISLICLGMAIFIWIVYRSVDQMHKRLGITGMNVISRIMGIVLVALGFILISTGLKELLPGLTG